MVEATQTRTAMIDGKEVGADQAAAIHDVRDVFDKLKKALKQIALYRHNVERYGEYLEGVHTALADFLERKGILELRVDAMAYKYRGTVVFEDDSRDNNLIYPFWNHGVRLFIFKPGISPDELLQFLMLALNANDETLRAKNEDIVTQLWKCEFRSIEYVVVEAFKVMPDEDPEEVEMAVEKVVAYLYRQLQSNSKDYLRFARISLDDLDLELQDVDQIRGAVVQGTTATEADRQRVQSTLETEDARVLTKLITVLFQLLELDTTEENFEDVAEAFVQLLDALLIGEKFSAIDAIRNRFEISMKKPQLNEATKDLVGRAQDRFTGRMGDAQRVQMIGQILNQGLVSDTAGVRGYLVSLGEDAVSALVEMLETLQLAPNRRLVADIIADMGHDKIEMFKSRLQHPSSNLVKDMLYIIDKVSPSDKYQIFSHVLSHPNAILRLETLSLIGKNNSDECFEIIKGILLTHEDAQMRSQAARSLPNFEPETAVPVLLDVVTGDRLENMEDPEKKALFTALGQMNVAETQSYLYGILETKGGLFGRRKMDDLKMLAIFALEANPSMPSLTKLAETAKDSKRNSKEVCEASRAAVIQMQARIMGGG